MTLLPLPETQTAICRTVLATYPDAWGIYLFGSLAQGCATPDSDADIGIVLPPKQTIADLLSLNAQISLAIGLESDVTDLRHTSDFLRKVVLEQGRCLHVGSPHLLEWEAQAMIDHADHLWRVRNLLKDFDATGTGYHP